MTLKLRPFVPMKAGDPIGVFAPAGPVDVERYEKGRALLAERYRVVEADNVRARAGYFAGDDAARRAATQALIDDPRLRGLIAARGGYGTMRILRQLDLSRLDRDPVPVAGFSDLTVLSMALASRGLSSLHAPAITQLAVLPREHVTALFDLLEGRHAGDPVPLVRAWPASGAATTVERAPFLGGNLTLLACLCGTGTLPSFRGAVLFLEEVGEEPYRLDRMLTQLRLAGHLDGVAAIVLGDLIACEPRKEPMPRTELAMPRTELAMPRTELAMPRTELAMPRTELAMPRTELGGPTALERIAACCADVGAPLFTGFPAGHARANLPFMHGSLAAITGDGASYRLRLEHGA